jgi:BirA family transcriptional regulator, biotin operon repressor / biotin---[acetyl-CoA-carboxylase] ligase
MYKILANTLFLGKDITYLTECHSTNDLALEKIKERSIFEGSIIVTDSQTAGKGQRGNQWISEPFQNLTFSLVLRPVFITPDRQFTLSMAVSNALIDMLGQYGISAMVKWPNDIVSDDGKKLAGILIENTLTHKRIEYAVVGIGLNINQGAFGSIKATSIANLLGRTIDVEDVFSRTVHELEKYYLMLKSGRIDEAKNRYMQKLYRYQVWAKYQDEDIFDGKIEGIDIHGRLEVKKTTGELVAFGLKEIKFL